jgi:hypothetical protein
MHILKERGKNSVLHITRIMDWQKVEEILMNRMEVFVDVYIL